MKFPVGVLLFGGHMAIKGKRAIEIEFLDGTTKELKIGKAVAMNGQSEHTSGKIYLEQMKDGDWRLLYTEDVIEDFTKVKGFNVVRED
jgi:hypothetical protein